jgi:hypothetical protein
VVTKHVASQNKFPPEPLLYPLSWKSIESVAFLVIPALVLYIYCTNRRILSGSICILKKPYKPFNLFQYNLSLPLHLIYPTSAFLPMHSFLHYIWNFIVCWNLTNCNIFYHEWLSYCMICNCIYQCSHVPLLTLKLLLWCPNFPSLVYTKELQLVNIKFSSFQIKQWANILFWFVCTDHWVCYLLWYLDTFICNPLFHTLIVLQT